MSEDANYTASLVKVPGGPVGQPLTGVAKAYFKPGLHFTNLKLAAGTYQFQIVLTAATNPSRSTTLTSSTFTVGTPTTIKPVKPTKLAKVVKPNKPAKVVKPKPKPKPLKCTKKQKLKKGKCVKK